MNKKQLSTDPPQPTVTTSITVSTKPTHRTRQASTYTRGSGPPLPTLSLLPPQNPTTGYIIDKSKFNRRLPSGETQLIVGYYVGYTDGRPASRALVPYSEILQHVSPRELEMFEERVSEMQAENKKEVEEEREKKAEEKRKKAEEKRKKAEEKWKKEVEGGKMKGRVTRGMRKRIGVEVEELEKLMATESAGRRGVELGGMAGKMAAKMTGKMARRMRNRIGVEVK